MKYIEVRFLARSSFWVILLVGSVGTLAILFLLSHNLSSQVSETRSFLIPALVYITIGLVILKNQAGNRVGLILSAMGLLFLLDVLTAEYEAYALLALSSNSLILDVAQRLSGLWILPFALLAFLLMVFPNGRLISQRWKWLAWLAALPALLNILWVGLPSMDAQLDELLGNVTILVLFICLPVSVVPLVLRYRRSRGVERQQIKWIVFAGSLLGVWTVLLNFASELVPLIRLDVIGTVLISSLPLAIAAAILRYHLWDIDLIIRRTLQYALLTGLLALVYFGSVVLLQSMFENLTGQRSPVVIVVSTLGIAALFNPLRLRVQRFIDRRFYRRKYDAEQTLAEFAAIARDEVDLDILTQALIGVMEKAIKPEYVSVWLKTLKE